MADIGDFESLRYLLADMRQCEEDALVLRAANRLAHQARVEQRVVTNELGTAILLAVRTRGDEVGGYRLANGRSLVLQRERIADNTLRVVFDLDPNGPWLGREFNIGSVNNSNNPLSRIEHPVLPGVILPGCGVAIDPSGQQFTDMDVVELLPEHFAASKIHGLQIF